MRHISCAIAIFSLIFLLGACANNQEIVNRAADGSKDAVGVVEQPKLKSESNADGQIDNTFLINSEEIEIEALSLIDLAFDFDCSKIPPKAEKDNNYYCVSYTEDAGKPWDFYFVEYYNEFKYPTTLYHFWHPESGEDISTDKEFEFDKSMVDEAKKFVERVYRIDCSNANVTAYGYANKISIQLDVDDSTIFQVRFYYKDSSPVGVLYFPSQKDAKSVMEKNDAIKLYKR